MHTLIHFRLLTILACLATATLANAALEFAADELKLPSSPLHALVGLSPTKIESPSSPSAFGATLLTAMTESEGSLPKNLAVEFAPYWWPHRTALTAQQYEQASLADVVLQSATISIATYEKPAKGTTPAYSGAGIGLRFDLVRGHANVALRERIQQKQLEYLGGGFDSDSLTPEQNAELKKLALTYDASRTGPQLSFGSAVAWKFEGNDLDEDTWDRYGAWLTLAYKPQDGKSPAAQFTALVSARYIVEHTLTNDKRYTDIGAKILWRAAEYPVSAALEYVYRNGDEKGGTFGGLIQYKVNESWHFFLSHGKQLEGDESDDKKLTAAGLSFSWGESAKLKL